MRCEVDNCPHYSDFDVYFEDGNVLSLCEQHERVPNHPSNPMITQVVPQHGSDDVNRICQEL